nr:MAG TPA: hypothetical protein [Caudoviricetes sp.]
MKKRKLKWYAIWVPYCILCTPLLIIILPIRYINELCTIIVSYIEKFKWYIVGKFKP